MRPNDQSGELLHPDPSSVTPYQTGPVQGATVIPPVNVTPSAVMPQPETPAELAGMLLPTEHVTFASSPHPISFVRPVAGIVVVLVALAVALSWQVHPVVRGHHITLPLLTGAARTGVLVVAGLLVLRELVSLVQRLFHYLSYRVVTTNRRVFIVEGLLGRRVFPLGNTGLAGATMSQGVLGRMLNFGDLFLPLAGAGPRVIKTIRDPVRLYHDFEAVAMGVEGDTWKQAIRQTQIP
jgi:Bacterial PH domain